MATSNQSLTARRSGFSKVIKQSVPRFILEEYPLFVDFLEAYYEWLDQYGNPIEFLKNGDRYFDIDSTTDEFLKNFKNTYLYGFPKTFAENANGVIDERTLIKNIREFYKIKGNEKSIKLLFKIITGSDTAIEYPRDYVFVLSSGNYRDYYKMYLLKDYTNLSLGFDPFKLKGLQIKQYEGVDTLIGSATIEDANEVSVRGKEYFILSLSNPVGNFVESDFMPTVIEQDKKFFYHYAISNVSELEIVSGGTGYAVGDMFSIGNTHQDFIKGFVSNTDERGSVLKVKLFSNPVNYTGTDTVYFETAFGTGADLSVTKSIISSQVDEYENTKNLLNKESRIQDSFQYQQFSYVIKSKRSLEEYIEALRTILHPAGFAVFNSLYNNIITSKPTEYKTRIMAYEYPSIGSYASYGLCAGTGAGSMVAFNPLEAGDQNPTKTWGKVFSKWNVGTVFVNPGATPPNGPGGNTAFLFGNFAPDRIFLRNDTESQVAGITHWIVFPHPSTRGMTAIPAGTLFQDISIDDVSKMLVPIITQ